MGNFVTEEIAGELLVEGSEDGEEVFARALPVTIKVISQQKVMRTAKITMPIISILSMIFLLISVVIIRNYRKQKSLIAVKENK